MFAGGLQETLNHSEIHVFTENLRELSTIKFLQETCRNLKQTYF